MGRSYSGCDCNIIHGENVEKVKREMEDDDLLFSMAEFYRIMGDSTRIRILNALSKCELCVCDISALLNMTKSAVSHQLKLLKDMNLISGQKRGKEVLYCLSDDHVVDMINLCKTHILEGESEK